MTDNQAGAVKRWQPINFTVEANGIFQEWAMLQPAFLTHSDKLELLVLLAQRKPADWQALIKERKAVAYA